MARGGRIDCSAVEEVDARDGVGKAGLRRVPPLVADVVYADGVDRVAGADRVSDRLFRRQSGPAEERNRGRGDEGRYRQWGQQAFHHRVLL